MEMKQVISKLLQKVSLLQVNFNDNMKDINDQLIEIRGELIEIKKTLETNTDN